MWKYVTRRIKDTFERSSVLDVPKTWTCNRSNQQAASSSCKDSEDDASSGNKCRNNDLKCSDFLVYFNSTKSGYSSSDSGFNGDYSNKDRNQAKFTNNDGHCRLNNTLLGALTWSGAIIFGWYASQCVCLHRRHLGWNRDQNRYAKFLTIPSRAVHTNIRSYVAFTAPSQCATSLNQKKALHEKFSLENLIVDPQGHNDTKLLHEVNNNDGTKTEIRKQSVQDAVSDLVTFLGETEYKIGVQQIAARRFRSAVAHLKLATSHNHAGATFNLGLCYEKGIGVPKNLKRAMECYQLASKMGHAKAIYNLGVFYARGLGGLEKDHDAARNCFVAAAKLGQQEAKYALSMQNHIPVMEETKAKLNSTTSDITKNNNFFLSSTTRYL